MKFESKPVAEHDESPLPDEGRWEAMVDQWSSRERRAAAPDGPNRTYVICASSGSPEDSSDGRMAEILGLVRAQGDTVVGSEVVRLRRADPRTLLGRGVCEAVGARALAHDANMLVVDAELSPSQQRNLEEAVGMAVGDREGVILNVFARHARTRKARIQVEIAHLEYLRPRIRGVGLTMDQQAGGVMGSRGPGETASELLARKLDGRLLELRRAFERLQRAGRVQRSRRDGSRRMALVGYTNAGKTTLMNGLTGAGLSAKDQPFETLDTTSRALTRHGGDVVVSDTVGFIRRLPERLLASFETTLAEAREADLLVLVVDGSDPEWALHVQTTHHVLEKLGVGDLPRFYVFNKADRLPAPLAPEFIEEKIGPYPYRMVHGRDRDSVDDLRHALVSAVRRNFREVTIFVPYLATTVMGWVYGSCRVLAAEPRTDGINFRLEASGNVVGQIQRALAEVTQ